MLVRIIEKVRETEKAVKLNVTVSWNDRMFPREFWFPKSVAREAGENLYDVKDWFIQKLGRENAFHGYTMNIHGADDICFHN